MKICKHCGADLVLIVNQRIHGSGALFYNFNTEDIDSSQIHDNLSYQTNKYARCSNCNKAIMKIEELYLLTEEWE